MLEISVERYTKIREAAEASNKAGITDQKLVREAVIDADSAQKKGILPISESEALALPSVAQKDIRKESPDVVERAINKYIHIEEGLPRIPVLVDAVHAVKPAYINNGEAGSDEYDESTGPMAKRVAELTGSSLIIAKKSRLIADLNRAWWTDQKRSGISTKEFPRSARAAFYWGIRKILLDADRLDENEQLREPYYRIAIHGMKNNDKFDFAIAGSERPASPEFLEKFADEFKKSLKEVNIDPQVVIALSGDKDTGAYSGPSNIRYFRETPKKDFLIQHPAFGNNFQTIQLEISNRMRTDPKNREAVCLALANVVKNLK